MSAPGEAATPAPGDERPIPIVAVGSGKGGVGKSTVAVNLAVALAARGRRVGLLDADITGPDVGLMLGARRRGPVDPRETPLAIGRARPLPPDRRLPAIERYGVRVFSVGMLIGEGQAVALDSRFIGPLVLQLLRDVAWGDLDLLLLDLPPGTGEPHATLVGARLARGVVVVTTPQEVAQVDAARFVRYFADARVPILGAVLNMSYFECPDCGARHAIWPRRDIAGGALAAPLLAEVPIAPAIAEAGDLGRPVVATHPESGAARAFLAAADRLWERLEEPSEPEGEGPT